MSGAFQNESITDAVSAAMKTYLAAVDAQLGGASIGERHSLCAGAIQAAATMHAAAEIQSAALDRLAIAIRSQRGD